MNKKIIWSSSTHILVVCHPCGTEYACHKADLQAPRYCPKCYENLSQQDKEFVRSRLISRKMRDLCD